MKNQVFLVHSDCFEKWEQKSLKQNFYICVQINL